MSKKGKVVVWEKGRQQYKKVIRQIDKSKVADRKNTPATQKS